jgi:hypothetical protein
MQDPRPIALPQVSKYPCPSSEVADGVRQMNDVGAGDSPGCFQARFLNGSFPRRLRKKGKKENVKGAMTPQKWFGEVANESR